MNQQEKVLFVVYRTEWWGCFDRLCRQECHEGNLVYVMPIPRYDRELGTTKIDYNKMRFHPERLEGELPEGAIAADYRTFALEQGFDRIYIHNPYDNTYFVDSVDEKYYSCNLKQYTKRLVYISYLIFIDGIPEEYTGSPVYEYADAIYLADKKAKYSLEVQYDKKVEIVPSGIPEYLKKLEKQVKRKNQTAQGKNTNGSAKRLLCCLSYHNLFYGSEKLIQKLRDVFAYLKGRKDILLVFRPDEDIRARFPWLDEPLQKKYAELVAYFQRYKIGIYDESPDLYRAVAEADGMLSFGHPADKLFLVQGKYVLRLDTVQRPIPSDEVRCIPSLWAMTAEETEDGIELWFVPERTKLICRAVIHKDLNSTEEAQAKGRQTAKRQEEELQVEIVAEVPDEIIGGLNYNNVIKIDKKIYLSPLNSEGIWEYDLDANCFYEYFLMHRKSGGITAFFSYEKYIYLIPRRYAGIVKFNTETFEMEIISDWIEELDKFVLPNGMDYPYFCWAVKQENNMLYMASSKCDIWMEFDMEKATWKMKSMKLPKRYFIDMVKKEEWVWLIPYGGGDEIILWNCKSCESQIVYKAFNGKQNEVPYEHILDMGNQIAVFPKHMNNMLLISSDSPKDVFAGKKTQVKAVTDNVPCREKDYLSEYQKQTRVGYQFVMKLQKGQILTYEYYDGAFLLLNNELQVIRKIYCRLSLETVKQQQNIVWENLQYQSGFSGILGEGYSLPAMLDYFAEESQKYRKEVSNYYMKKIKQ